MNLDGAYAPRVPPNKALLPTSGGDAPSPAAERRYVGHAIALRVRYP